MNVYRGLLRPFLILFPPELSHRMAMALFSFFLGMPGIRGRIGRYYHVGEHHFAGILPGLTFRNPVGLAAGFDKNARLLDELAALGFGFVEVGTVTPCPQPGNPAPRIFRLPRDFALINRLGFNNDGADAMLNRLKKFRQKFLPHNPPVVIGVNIGKGRDTPNSQAVNDYLFCFDKLHEVADYFAVNISSPNTPGLRDLQEKKALTKILSALRDCNARVQHPRPVLLKISPDLTPEQTDDILEVVRSTGAHGIIATNTSVSRNGLSTPVHRLKNIGAGGLSGKPLAKRSTDMIRYLAEKTGYHLPIIGVGGILSPGDAVEKICAGACLVQLYTGLVYEGPSLIKKIREELLRINPNFARK